MPCAALRFASQRKVQHKRWTVKIDGVVARACSASTSSSATTALEHLGCNRKEVCWLDKSNFTAFNQRLFLVVSVSSEMRLGTSIPRTSYRTVAPGNSHRTAPSSCPNTTAVLSHKITASTSTKSFHSGRFPGENNIPSTCMDMHQLSNRHPWIPEVQ